ncbi:hypothetical protein AB0E63_28780 [Kribbella sp. NPDC026596]|uniref:hypothetical protein n=1 Tax=Kribbella sp. NPDC026596 TaxID=3155122 RepID=UPI0033F00C00
MAAKNRPLVAAVAAVAVGAVAGGGLLAAAREPRSQTGVLLLWNDKQDPQSRAAVVRCTVSTNQCELATPLSPEPLLLGS